MSKTGMVKKLTLAGVQDFNEDPMEKEGIMHTDYNEDHAT